MASISSFPFQSALLFSPPIIAALGGIAFFHLRDSKAPVGIVQLAAATILFGLGLTFRVCNFSFAVWLAPTVLSLYLSLAMAARLPSVVAVSSRVVIMVNALAAPHRWGVLLLGISPLFLAGGLWQLNAIATPKGGMFEDIKDFPAPDLKELSEISANTDRGRRIPIFKIREEMLANAAIVGDQGLPLENTPVPYRAIRLGDADSVSNCAGWVFTAAHHWIHCRDVENILDDNGYQVVRIGRPGDLAVYRDQDGAVSHIGCVVASTDEGRPLIESKWGSQGLFLHLPEATPYGDVWSFYHSSRHNHLLLLTPSLEASVRSSNENTP